MKGICSTPGCTQDPRPDQRDCYTCHAESMRKYRLRAETQELLAQVEQERVSVISHWKLQEARRIAGQLLLGLGNPNQLLIELGALLGVVPADRAHAAEPLAVEIPWKLESHR